MLEMNRVAALAALAGAAVAVSAQTDIDWVGGTSNWNNAANWSPADIPNTALENARILAPAFAVVQGDLSASIGQLVVAADLTLELDPNRALFVNGGVINNGMIVLNPTTSGGNATIRFDASGSLTGTGTLRLAGGTDDARLDSSASTVTNVLGHTIDGAGQIPAQLINNSLVSAFETGFGNSIELTSSDKVNNDTFQAAPGGELILSANISQGPGGVIAANAGGTVTLNGNHSITGGRILGPGQIVRSNSGTTTLSDVSLEGDLDVGIVATVLYTSSAFNCPGRIILNDSTNSNNAVLRFAADTTVSGGGSVFLAGGGNDSLIESTTMPDTTVTFAPGFTVEGSGQISARMNNQGLVRAFPGVNNDGRLLVNQHPKANTGVMRADPGGTLEFQNVTVVQDAEGGPAGLILADGGEVLFTGSQTVMGGTLGTANGGILTRANSGTLTLIDTAIDGDMNVGVVATVAYSGGTLNCTGTISLNDSSSANDAILRFDTDSTITGGGRVFLGGSSNDSQIGTTGSTLTVAPDFLIEGSGQITASLINNGLVRTALGDNADGRLHLTTNDKVNNATMSAETGGVLELENITITQGSAGVLLADGGTLQFDGNPTVSGGTIRTANGGTAFRTNSGTLFLDSVAIDGDLSVGVVATVVWTGPVLDCNGSIILNDSISSNDAVLRFDTDATATGGGRIFLAGSQNDSQVNTVDSTLTIGSDFTVEGSGTVSAVIVNEGLVRAFPSDNGDGRLILDNGLKTNNGLMVADTGGTLSFINVDVVQNAEGAPAGSMRAAAGGVVEFIGNGSVTGGQLVNDGGEAVRRTSGTTTLTDVVINGDFAIEPVATAAIVGGLQNDGRIRINATGSSNDGILRFDTNTTVTGEGDIVLEGGVNDSQINTNAVTATFGPDQRIIGEGEMNGDFVVDGTMAPGLPIGAITGIANIEFGDGAVFEAATSAAGVGDRLALSGGSVDLGGSVEVLLSYVPAVNDQFNIIGAPAINGLFDDVFVTLGSLPSNIDVRLVYTPTTVDVKFVCIADLAEPFGVLDLQDVNAFVQAFVAQDPLADIAEPIGVFDLSDLNAFVVGFLGQCQ